MIRGGSCFSIYCLVWGVWVKESSIFINSRGYSKCFHKTSSCEDLSTHDCRQNFILTWPHGTMASFQNLWMSPACGRRRCSPMINTALYSQQGLLGLTGYNLASIQDVTRGHFVYAESARLSAEVMRGCNAPEGSGERRNHYSRAPLEPSQV